jgi:hypothetical protein
MYGYLVSNLGMSNRSIIHAFRMPRTLMFAVHECYLVVIFMHAGY